jgi:hypothetical protein
MKFNNSFLTQSNRHQIFFGACFMFMASANAELVTSTGEYLFGPETSQSKACELAQEKAKSAALTSVIGESISNEQQLFCKETSGKKSDYECEYNSVAWSLIEGDTKSPTVLKTEIQERTGARSCIVTLQVDVIVPSGKPDPNFTINARLNQSVFRVGDDFIIEFESSMPSYFAIFNWLPSENNNVNRVLLSNSGDPTEPDNLTKKSVSGKFLFNQLFVTSWSDAYSGRKKFVDEWVVLVVTKKPYKWLSSYDLDSFKEQLREIPIDQRRIRRLGYQLTK